MDIKISLYLISYDIEKHLYFIKGTLNMSKKRKSRPTYVNHPRYGDQPVHSGNIFSVEEIELAYWDYDRSSFFPETDIAAVENRTQNRKRNISA